MSTSWLVVRPPLHICFCDEWLSNWSRHSTWPIGQETNNKIQSLVYHFAILSRLVYNPGLPIHRQSHIHIYIEQSHIHIHIRHGVHLLSVHRTRRLLPSAGWGSKRGRCALSSLGLETPRGSSQFAGEFPIKIRGSCGPLWSTTYHYHNGGGRDHDHGAADHDRNEHRGRRGVRWCWNRRLLCSLARRSFTKSFLFKCKGSCPESRRSGLRCYHLPRRRTDKSTSLSIQHSASYSNFQEEINPPSMFTFFST